MLVFTKTCYKVIWLLQLPVKDQIMKHKALITLAFLLVVDAYYLLAAHASPNDVVTTITEEDFAHMLIGRLPPKVERTSELKFLVFKDCFIFKCFELTNIHHNYYSIRSFLRIKKSINSRGHSILKFIVLSTDLNHDIKHSVKDYGVLDCCYKRCLFACFDFLKHDRQLLRSRNTRDFFSWLKRQKPEDISLPRKLQDKIYVF